MNQIAFDPGLHSLGWAAWTGAALEPFAAGIIKPTISDNHNLLERAANMGDQCAQAVKRLEVEQAWCEFPTFYGGTDKRAGDIFRLCACIGAIAHAVDCFIEPVEVRDWKGQLPKPVVIKRIQAKLGFGVCNYLRLDKDMWDAVGIGLYKKGALFV